MTDSAMKIIKVNVGGQIFMTSKSNLLKIPYFDTNDKLGGGGEIFIDQNPKYFEVILDLARESKGSIKGSELQWKDEYKIYFTKASEIASSEVVKSESINYFTQCRTLKGIFTKSSNAMMRCLTDYAIFPITLKRIEEVEESKIQYLIDCPQAAYIKPQFTIRSQPYNLSKIEKIILKFGNNINFPINCINFPKENLNNLTISFWETENHLDRWIPNRNAVPIKLEIVLSEPLNNGEEEEEGKMSITTEGAFFENDVTLKSEFLIVPYQVLYENNLLIKEEPNYIIKSYEIIIPDICFPQDATITFNPEMVYSKIRISEHYKGRGDDGYYHYIIEFGNPGYCITESTNITFNFPCVENIKIIATYVAKLTWTHDADQGNKYSLHRKFLFPPPSL